jgi:hypothetical protein
MDYKMDSISDTQVSEMPQLDDCSLPPTVKDSAIQQVTLENGQIIRIEGII